VLVCVDTVQRDEEYAGRVITLPETTRLVVSPFKTLGDFLKLCRTLRQFKPNILHFQEAAGPRRAMFNAALARLLRSSAAIVVTIHDPMAHAGRDAGRARRTAGIAAYLRKSADKIVVHGTFCAAQMVALIPSASDRLLISEHGVILEPDILSPQPEPSPLRLYFFGRMEAYKGVEILLAAAEALHAEGFPFALSIAGRGPELDRLEDRFKRLPEVSIFNGFVPPTRIMTDIQSTECVVLPYLSATQSGVLAAAYAGHRYVLATSTGGLPDVVVHGQNGLLVSPGDAEALAGAIRMLGRNTALRAQLLRGARATAEGQLNWTSIAESTAQSFVPLMHAKG
jgi:glycosyltransferase involved in cell wall biosynthesis